MLRSLLSSLLLIPLASTLASAEAPAFLPVQGQLAQAAGKLVDGPIKVRFRLYDRPSPTGDTSEILHEEEQEVTVMNGQFTAYLGDQTSLDLQVFRRHSLVFLGMLVDGDDAELKPLLQLATAPYAAYANACGDADTLGGKTVEEVVAAAKPTTSGSGQSGSSAATGPAGPKGDPGVIKVTGDGRVTASLQNQNLTLGFVKPYFWSKHGQYPINPRSWSFIGMSDSYTPSADQICIVQVQGWMGFTQEATSNSLKVVASVNGSAPSSEPLAQFGYQETPFIGRDAGFSMISMPVVAGTRYSFGCGLWNESDMTQASCRVMIHCI